MLRRRTAFVITSALVAKGASDPVFPVCKNHYDVNAVGQILLHNYDPAEAQNITVSATVKDDSRNNLIRKIKH